MTTEKLTSVHPGEIILEDFIKQLGVSQYRLCKDISVQPRSINQIVRGDRPSPPKQRSVCPVTSGPRTGLG